MYELLRAASPHVYGFSKVIIWSGRATLERIEDRPWLVKSYLPILDKGLFYRALWQRFRLPSLARMTGCDVLFVPGGSYAGDFHPVVTFSQNLLPFEWRESRRYGCSWMTFKLLILRLTQSRTFRHADGLIFLTQYARNVVMQVIKTTAGKIAIVPHGINDSFASLPREQLPISRYSIERPFRILYVSIIDVYKHQWKVAEAVVNLRKKGMPVVLDLVGPAYPPAMKRLRKTLDRIDPAGIIVKYSGAIPYGELHHRYAEADLCLFASSCENMPIILLEGMASGLPIACSCKGPMPEVLGQSGVYFNPEKVSEIEAALHTLIGQLAMRNQLALEAHQKAGNFSWVRCAEETFSFIARIARDTAQNKQRE